MIWDRSRISAPAAVAGFVVVVLALGLGIRQSWAMPSKAPTAPAEGPTAWDKITAKIHDGVVPADAALEGFSLLFGVKVPGVQVSGRPKQNDYPRSGTGVLRWLDANWPSLTSDQRQVVERFKGSGPRDTVLDIPSGAPSPPDRPGAGCTAPAGSGDRVWRQALCSEVSADLTHIAGRLGLDVLGGAHSPHPVTVTLASDLGGPVLLQAVMSPGANSAPVCNIKLYRSLWTAERTKSPPVSPTLHELLINEIVHCYENSLWGTPQVAAGIPSWISEGSAMFLAVDDAGPDPSSAGTWKYHYVLYPDISLTDRAEDAVGYFSLLQRHDRNLWGTMAQAWRAAAASPDRSPAAISDAFLHVVNGDGDDVRAAWAPSFARVSDWGNPWVMSGVGLPADATVSRAGVDAPASPGSTLKVASRANAIVNVTGSGGTFVTIHTDGLASVHDRAGHSALAFTTEVFCVARAGCQTPPPSCSPGGPPMHFDRLSLPFVLTVNASKTGASYTIAASDQPGTPTGVGGPCQQQLSTGALGAVRAAASGSGPCDPGCAASTGDPHVRTVDGAAYDFQAAGEFTLLRWEGSEIQARQEVFGPGKVHGHQTVNTALAIRSGSDHLSISLTPSGLLARLDGATAPLSTPAALADGSRVVSYPLGYEVDLADGSIIWALSAGRWGINVELLASPLARSTGVGVFGAVDGPKGSALPALPDGSVLPQPVGNQQLHDLLYGRFADAWRVPRATSLFDYDSGSTPDGYARRNFPAESDMIDDASLSAGQRRAGQAACNTLTDRTLHDQCVFDVAVTGDSGFVQSYVVVDKFLSMGTAALSTPSLSALALASPPGVGPTILPPGPVAVALRTDIQGVKGKVIGPNGIVYVLVSLGDTRRQLLVIDPSAQRILHKVDLTATDRLAFAAGSVWADDGCTATRIDAGSLATQALVPIGCGAQEVVAGDALWISDPGSRGAGGKPVLQRIDPATNVADGGIELPDSGGSLLGTPTSVFYYGGVTNNVFRLRTGGTGFQSLGGGSAHIVAVADGFWVQQPNGGLSQAQYFIATGNPQRTIPMANNLIGGDDRQLYAVEAGISGRQRIMRIPLVGDTTPVPLGTAPVTDAGAILRYDNPSDVLIGRTGSAAVWSVPAAGAQALYVQWMPLP